MNRTARMILATGVALAVTLPVVGDVVAAAPSGRAGSTAATTTAATTIEVHNGDSLAGIAWRYSVRLSVLLQANSLQLTSVIHPGDTLTIPAGATIPATGPAAGASASTMASSPASSTVPTASTGPGIEYVVQSGDALAGIAWRHGVILGALVKANNIATTSVILPGQQLHIPAATRPIPTGVEGAAAATPAATPAPGAAAVSQGSSLQTLLSYATAQVGVPYKFYSAGPDSFDCSGLVVAAFRKIGMTVPHQSRALARLGTPVDWRSEPIAAGDLVFTSVVNDPELITHVGIALDSRRWVHAVGFGRTVSIGAIPASGRIMAVQRIALS